MVEGTPAKDGYGNFGAAAIANLNIRNRRKPRLAYHAKDKRDNKTAVVAAAANNPSRNVVTGEKMLEKNLASCERYGKDVGKSNKEKDVSKRERGAAAEERHRNVKCKTVSRNLSRKAKSFFRKKSRLTITDSACTLILPGLRGVKGKIKYSVSKVSLALRARNRINSIQIPS